jgi:hypothetical protein
LLANPCHNYPYHIKCHLAYLSYFSQNPNIKSILHDGTTFMSYEFQTGLIHVVLTSPKTKAPVA